MTTSFGEYFDDQRDRMIKDMQNKNTLLHKEWREDYDKRQRVRDLARLRKDDKGVSYLNEVNKTLFLDEEINTNILQNNEDWENEDGNSGSYNSAQMLNGSFEGDTISQIGKKHKKTVT